MAEKKSLAVFRIEYEIFRDMSMWTAFIVSWSHEEAVRTLMRRVGPNHRIISSGLASRVDAISDEVRDWVVNKTIGKKKEREETPKNQEKQDVVEDTKKVSLKRK